MYTYKQRQDAINKAIAEYELALIRLEEAQLELMKYKVIHNLPIDK